MGKRYGQIVGTNNELVECESLEARISNIKEEIADTEEILEFIMDKLLSYRFVGDQTLSEVFTNSYIRVTRAEEELERLIKRQESM